MSRARPTQLTIASATKIAKTMPCTMANDVGETHQHVVDPATDVAREHPDRRADDEDHRHRHDADDETHSRAVHESREDVSAKLIGPEEVCGVGEPAPEEPCPDRLHQLLRSVLLDGIVRRHDLRGDGDQGRERDHHHAHHRRAIPEETPERVAPERALLAGEDCRVSRLHSGPHRGRHQATLIRGSRIPYTMSTVMLATMMMKAYRSVVAMIVG